MASNLDPSTSHEGATVTGDLKSPKAPPRGWMKVGAVAAASALVGGLAAAWFYRKTLADLRRAESNGSNPEVSASEDFPEEDF
jgi:hypothetical protein